MVGQNRRRKGVCIPYLEEGTICPQRISVVVRVLLTRSYEMQSNVVNSSEVSLEAMLICNDMCWHVMA